MVFASVASPRTAVGVASVFASAAAAVVAAEADSFSLHHRPAAPWVSPASSVLPLCLPRQKSVQARDWVREWL